MKIFALLAILALVTSSVYANDLTQAREPGVLDTLFNGLELLEQELDQHELQFLFTRYAEQASNYWGHLLEELKGFGQVNGTVSGNTAVWGPNTTIGQYAEMFKRWADFSNVFGGRGGNTGGGVGFLDIQQDSADQPIEDFNLGTFYRKAEKVVVKANDVANKIADRAAIMAVSIQAGPEIEALESSKKELVSAAKEYQDGEKDQEGFNFEKFLKKTIKYSGEVLDVASKMAVVAEIFGGIDGKFSGNAGNTSSATNTIEALELGNYFKNKKLIVNGGH
mmetsp:Transcript_83096/g.97097  ORF Transcript_83096/g.97097 Transcript_83096/m.97097 type:complete len:279 (+) Transcript_83096:25-861(+)